MRWTSLLAACLALAAPLVAGAADAPHEIPDNCDNCHRGHNSQGAGLTNTAGTFNLCDSCHKVNHNFGFPWTPEIDQAVPGVSGRSHRWDADATNLGATPPDPSSSNATARTLAGRLDNGKLRCTTCHDAHQADVQPSSGRGQQFVSAVVKTGLGTGAMTLLQPVGTVSAAKAYILEVVAGSTEADATFKLSNDGGKSWWGCSSPTVYTYVAWSTAPTNPCRVGADVPLNDPTPANVRVAFGTGTYVAGARWKFYVSYPFLRADNTDAAMCTACHQDRNMTSENVHAAPGVPHAGTGETIVPGTTVFHHPVNEVLAAAPLDADGSSQPGDGIASNDLALGSGNRVTCLTCHRVHNADSNSLSADP